MLASRCPVAAPWRASARRVVRKARDASSGRDRRPAQRPDPHAASSTAAASASSVPSSAGAADDPEQFWRIVLPTGLTLLLCNMDRICMSVAIVPMAAEFGWAPGVQGLIQGAFLWGYALTQVVGGTLADRMGGKIVIAYAIKMFSLASLILPVVLRVAPAVHTLAAVVATRFLVGMGEGFVLPSMNALVATQIATAAKARALGIIFTFFHCGNLVGLLLSPLIIQQSGWHSLFLTFGALGLPLLAVWYGVMPRSVTALSEAEASSSSGSSSDEPAFSPPSPFPTRTPPPREASLAASTTARVAAEDAGGKAPLEAASARPDSVLDFLRHPAVLAIVAANFVNHWGYFIYLAWIPSFFVNVYGLDVTQSALLSLGPWIAMAVGSSLAGVLADWLVKRHEVELVRKVIQAASFVAPALAVMALTVPSVTAQQASAFFIAALGMQSLGQAGFVANMSDIAPHDAGKLFGLCNTFGSFAGIIGVSAAGYIFQATGSFDWLFRLTAALYIAGAAAFWRYAKAEPVLGAA